MYLLVDILDCIELNTLYLSSSRRFSCYIDKWCGHKIEKEHIIDIEVELNNH